MDSTSITRLSRLSQMITNCTEKLANYKHLSTLGYLEAPRIFYKPGEIDRGIRKYERVLGRLVLSWNEYLETMKIK